MYFRHELQNEPIARLKNNQPHVQPCPKYAASQSYQEIVTRHVSHNASLMKEPPHHTNNASSHLPPTSPPRPHHLPHRPRRNRRPNNRTLQIRPPPPLALQNPQHSPHLLRRALGRLPRLRKPRRLRRHGYGAEVPADGHDAREAVC